MVSLRKAPPGSRFEGFIECQPILLPFKIDVIPYHIRVSLSGLEPETYGLKVRCSTD